jgi:hypothetical protein
MRMQLNWWQINDRFGAQKLHSFNGAELKGSVSFRVNTANAALIVKLIPVKGLGSSSNLGVAYPEIQNPMRLRS